jgi:hypothetical protein
MTVDTFQHLAHLGQQDDATNFFPEENESSPTFSNNETTGSQL